MEYFAAGAVAGLTVDVSLYPIDTVKTRMQSREGFLASGGLRGIYRGLSIAAVGSVPSAACFFCGYELTKKNLEFKAEVNQGLGAVVGETMSCFVRVPVDTIKQRMQKGEYHTMIQGVRQVVLKEGLATLFRGMPITLARDIPFAIVQMLTYEAIRKERAPTWLCGAFAGAVAGFVTTPLDVGRTRILLRESDKGVLGTTIALAKEGGLRVLFKGASVRVLWISLGGGIFFSAYEFSKGMLCQARR